MFTDCLQIGIPSRLSYRQALGVVPGEQELVRALGDAMSRADQKLLQDVRGAAADHEARRGAILNELQSLAARMGALPRPREPYTALTEAPQRAVRPGGADGALPKPQESYDALTAAGFAGDAEAGKARRLAPGGRQYRRRRQQPFDGSRVGELTCSTMIAKEDKRRPGMHFLLPTSVPKQTRKNVECALEQPGLPLAPRGL
jgi:hypothetical protein